MTALYLCQDLAFSIFLAAYAIGNMPPLGIYGRLNKFTVYCQAPKEATDEAKEPSTGAEKGSPTSEAATDATVAEVSYTWSDYLAFKPLLLQG